jgi:hypothetical protein
LSAKQASASFFREKKKQKKLPDFGSEMPQPANPIPPHRDTEGEGIGSAGDRRHRAQTNKNPFCFFFRKAKRRSLSYRPIT